MKQKRNNTKKAPQKSIKGNDTKKKAPVYNRTCTVCRKKFETFIRNRKVCLECVKTQPVKRRLVSIKNKDGLTFKNKCVSCGTIFQTINNQRHMCTACACENLGISQSTGKSLFRKMQSPLDFLEAS